MVKLCDSLSEAPESPINQACEDWSETKAAYRFFQNEQIDTEQIMAAHRGKTSMRSANHHTIPALQDTSYFVYTNHPETKGLGELSLKKGENADNIPSLMLVTPAPIVTFVRLELKANAIPPMLVALPGIVTLARLEQKLNALSPMVVTLPGMVTLVS